MSTERRNLSDLQNWMQTAIMTPWDSNREELDQVVLEGTGNLDRGQRLGIYTRSYQGRLVECMESEFPVLCHALGKDLFTRFASEYLMGNPSQSYTLYKLGERFPAYLRDTRPEDDSELWPEFIIELGTLERLFGEVYHGEGVELLEGHASTDTVDILKEPGVRIMRCRFPVDEYFIGVRQHLRDDENTEPPEFPEPEEMALLIFRRNYVVQLRRISAELL